MRYDMSRPLVGIMAMSSNDSSEWSDYFKSLDPIHRRRYLEKLLLMGLDDHGDPYASQWKSMEAYNYFKSGFVLVMKCRYI